MTDLEVSKLFSSSDVVNPELLPEIIDKEQMLKANEMRKENNIKILEEFGFTNIEANKIIESGVQFDIQEISKNEVMSMVDEIAIRETSTPLSSIKATNYHQWIGTVPASYLEGENNCRFHKDAYPTTVRGFKDGLPYSYYVGYVTYPYIDGYELKNKCLEYDSMANIKVAEALYNEEDLSHLANYNLYGELPFRTQTNFKNVHKGTDFKKSFSGNYGEQLYSIFDLTGEVVFSLPVTCSSSAKKDPANTSALGVYYPSINVTVIYERLLIDGNLYEGKTITKGTEIGTEDYFGTKNGSHTHIQLQLGEVTGWSGTNPIKTLSESSSAPLDTLDPASYFTLYSAEVIPE